MAKLLIVVGGVRRPEFAHLMKELRAEEWNMPLSEFESIESVLLGGPTPDSHRRVLKHTAGVIFDPNEVMGFRIDRVFPGVRSWTTRPPVGSQG